MEVEGSTGSTVADTKLRLRLCKKPAQVVQAGLLIVVLFRQHRIRKI